MLVLSHPEWKLTCPKIPLLLVSVGESRTGGAAIEGGIDQRAAGEARGYRAMRVNITTLREYGSSTDIYDFVVSCIRDRWVIVERTKLMTVH
jgi:hypothetical protein